MFELAATIGTTALWTAGCLAALLAFGVVLEAVLEALGRASFPPPGRRVEVGGVALHLLQKGDAPGPTIVFEMGAAEPSPLFWDVQDEIARFARVVTYDRAGFGWSGNPKSPPTLESRAADLAGLLKAADVPGPYILVGHSLGGPLIRVFARDQAADVAGFVFIDTPDETSLFRPSYRDFVQRKMKPMMSAMGLATRIGLVRLVSVFIPGIAMIPDKGGAQARRALKALSSPRGAKSGLQDFDSLLQVPEARRQPGGLGPSLGDRPVFVITHGQAFPPPWDVLEIGWEDGQKRLAALSTNSVLVVAEKSNHLIQQDEPEVVVDAIRRVWIAARDRTPLAHA